MVGELDHLSFNLTQSNECLLNAPKSNVLGPQFEWNKLFLAGAPGEGGGVGLKRNPLAFNYLTVHMLRLGDDVCCLFWLFTLTHIQVECSCNLSSRSRINILSTIVMFNVGCYGSLKDKFYTELGQRHYNLKLILR